MKRLVLFCVLSIFASTGQSQEIPTKYRPHVTTAEFHYGGAYVRYINADVQGAEEEQLFRKSLKKVQEELPIHELYLTNLSEANRLANLMVLEEARGLRLLSLGGANFDRTQLTVLGKLEKLQDLWISGQEWNAAELKALGSAKSITGLRAQCLGVTDWKSFPVFPKLEELDLGYSNFNDEAVSAIVRQPSIKSLHLYETAVTDAGLMKLGEMKNLTFIGLPSPDEGGKVTWDGVEKFKAAFPAIKLNLDRPHTPHPPKAPAGPAGPAPGGREVALRF